MRPFTRHFILGGLVVASATASATAPGLAQYHPWCLVLADKAGSWTCYFATREQCVASAGGNMGFCAQNPAYQGPPPAPSRRHREHD